MRKVGTTIVSGPVRYSGGAMERREFEFDKEQQTILIDADFWREVVLMAHWVQDAVIVRWAEMTARLSQRDSTISAGGVLELLLSTAEPLRMDQQIRGIYEGKLPLECVWTEKRLVSSFDVDHALPFALWQDSSSWNLFPAARSVNNRKRDKLPALALVRRRKEVIVSYWELLYEAAPSRFAHEAQKLVGAPLSVTNRNWQNPLFSTFVEAIEYTATSRGVPRWEP